MDPARLECLAGVTEPAHTLLEQATTILEGASRMVVLTGAGVSAESGVPTFRGDQGLWRSYRPEELATADAFRRDPELVWSWYQWRRDLIADCVPNSGHHALARLALGRDGVTLVTQNVDGLHHRAAHDVGGSDPELAYPLEVHGAIHRDRCSGCGRLTPATAGSKPGPPSCVTCRSPLRPDVVWFGESLDPVVIGTAQEAAIHADVCLVAGTSALVYPAAGLPELTLRSGGAVVEVNLDPTPLTGSATVSIRGQSGVILPEIVGA